MARRIHERIYEPVWSKGAWSVLPISNVILHTWVACWIDKVGEGVSFAAAGVVPAIEKAVLVPSKGGQTDIAPFMTANTSDVVTPGPFVDGLLAFRTDFGRFLDHIL